MTVTMFVKAIFIFFICLIIFTLLSIILWRIYNKFITNKLSGVKRKILSVLTIVIFILCSISLSLIFSVKSFTNSLLDNNFHKIEKYICETYPNNEYVTKGIDLDKIIIKKEVLQSVIQSLFKDDENAQIENKIISEFKSMMPSSKALGIKNEKIYNMLFDMIFDQSYLALGTHVDFVYSFADENNIISVSSFLNNTKIMAKKKLSGSFNKAIIFSIIPILIYIIVSYIYVLRVVKKETL